MITYFCNLDFNGQHLIDQMPGFFAVVDLNGKFLTANNAALQLSGFKRFEHLLGRSYFDMNCKASEKHDDFVAQDLSVLKSDKPLKILGNYCYSNGNWRILFGEKFVLKNHDNNPVGIAQHFYDVTHNNVIDLSNLYQLSLTECHRINQRISQTSFIIEDQYPNVDLSQRETESLFYLLRGHTAKHIGTILGLSVRTIETYLDNIKRKLMCESKSQLIEKALFLGYLHIIPQKLLHYKV